MISTNNTKQNKETKLSRERTDIKSQIIKENFIEIGYYRL